MFHKFYECQNLQNKIYNRLYGSHQRKIKNIPINADKTVLTNQTIIVMEHIQSYKSGLIKNNL